MSLKWLMVLIVNFCTCFGRNYFTVAPSYGDLVLENNTSNLYISLAPDGIERAEYLYPICGDSIRSDSRATQVIAKQLGYSTCRLQNPPVSEVLPKPPMFYGKGMYCNGDEYHILRCLNMTLTKTCHYYVRVVCDSRNTFFDVNKDSDKEYKGYKGQVVLLPPLIPDCSKKINILNASASMGIVAIKQEGNCKYWRYLEIEDNHTVSLLLAHTICHQMGYTHANPSSILSRSNAETIYNLDFSYWDAIIGYPVIQTSEIDCGRQSPECLGCCDYKPDLDCLDNEAQPQPLAIEDRNKLLVLRCSFYKDGNIPSGGTNNLCAFKENGTSCVKDVPLFPTSNVPTSTGNSLSQQVFYAGIGTSLAAVVAISIALFVIIGVILSCKYFNRCPYRMEIYDRFDNENPHGPVRD